MRRVHSWYLPAILAVPLHAQARVTSDDALLWLKKGNERFVAGKTEARPLSEGVRRTLAKGQHPYAIVWTCADSRVAPEHLFNTGLGELFVVRTAGSASDAESLASVEYAAEHLDCPLLIVLGHSGCGAVKATIDDAKATPAIRRVIERIAPAVQRARREGREGSDLLAAAVGENVYETVAQAQLRSASLRERVRLGRFKIVAGRYDLASGAVEWLPERPVAAEPAARPAQHKTPALPPHTVLSMLQAGHRRYVGGTSANLELTDARRQALAGGQHPSAIVVTCADSRVAPEHVFNCGLGEIFVVRVAGNVLNDSVQASVEYAAEHLGASLVLWMGHAQCGAVKAALASDEHAKVSESMRRLLERIEPAVERARRLAGKAEAAELLAAAVDQNVLQGLASLRKGSEVVRELEEQGKLGLVPLVYELESGDIRWLDEARARSEREKHVPAAPAAEGHTKAEHAEAHAVAHEPEAPHAENAHPSAPATPPHEKSSILVTVGIALLVAMLGVTLFGFARRKR